MLLIINGGDGIMIYYMIDWFCNVIGLIDFFNVCVVSLIGFVKGGIVLLYWG